jgi:putative membrane protein
MGSFFTKLFVNVVALLTVAYLLPGVHVQNLMVAVAAAIVFALINTFIKPAILIITLPINILSLGIFTFFINGVLFYFVSRLVSGFNVEGFWSAFWGALLFSFVSFFLNLFLGEKGGKNRFYFYKGPGKTGNDLPSGNSKYKDAIDAEIVEDKKEEKK